MNPRLAIFDTSQRIGWIALAQGSTLLSSRRLDEARQLTPEATLRAYRLYLAGCAMSFERGWVSLFQLLASRPDGDVESGAMRGAQSAYPFNREYVYCGA